MDTLNFHHLRYFHAVAAAGHLGQAAERLNVSQSSVSIQIKQLEERIGQPLFDRVGRKLVLTEAGRIALDYADRIFTAGDELLSTLKETRAVSRTLRIGAHSTLSRNFQLQFLRPVMEDQAFTVALKSGTMTALMDDLTSQALDVVLSTDVPQVTQGVTVAAEKISEQAVALHGRRDLIAPSLRETLETAPLILPTDSVIRAAFESLLAKLDVQPFVAADVDDMAMVRLLAREGMGVAVAPGVVLADEIASGALITAPFDLGIVEPFYAVTLPRRFPHPALTELLGVRQQDKRRP